MISLLVFSDLACRSSWNSSKSTVLSFKFGNTTPSHTAARTCKATKAAENGKQYGRVMCLKNKDLKSWWLLALAKTNGFQTTLIFWAVLYVEFWVQGHLMVHDLTSLGKPVFSRLPILVRLVRFMAEEKKQVSVFLSEKIQATWASLNGDICHSWHATSTKRRHVKFRRFRSLKKQGDMLCETGHFLLAHQLPHKLIASGWW